jgi:glucokinase
MRMPPPDSRVAESIEEKGRKLKASTKILAADIGGTHSRFGFFQIDAAGQLVCRRTEWLDTRQASSFMDLIGQLDAVQFALPPQQADVAVFSIAGPVMEGSRSRPPNIAWNVDMAEFARHYKIDTSLLINDFVAQAYACRSPAVESAEQILPGRVNETAPLVVIGAGTGLGQAALVPVPGGQLRAVPSEAGHGSFPFESTAEADLMRFLLDQTGEAYVRTETILSGRGLSRVHQFLTGQSLAPADVAGSLKYDSQTLRWMARFFGRVCRNSALQFLAYGGVYIAGGVAAKTPRLVTHAAFGRAFRQSPTMAAVLERIPVFLNTNEESGLWGAAFRGVQLLKKDVSTLSG